MEELYGRKRKVRTQAEILEGIDLINTKIMEWTKRPAPEVDRLAYYRPQKNRYVYYGGRTYNSDEVMHELFKLFSTEDVNVIFHKAFVQVALLFTEPGSTYVQQTVEDFQNGNDLPSFVIEAYKTLVLKK